MDNSEIFRFRNARCRLRVEHYHNGNNALQFIDIDAGEPYLTASVNPSVPLPPDTLAVKNWSENNGVDDCLLCLGIIGDCVGKIPSGFVTIPVYKLTDKGKQLFGV